MRYVLNMVLLPGADLESVRVAAVAAARGVPTFAPMVPSEPAGLQVAEVTSSSEAGLRGLVAALEPLGMLSGWHIYEDAPQDETVMPGPAPAE